MIATAPQISTIDRQVDVVVLERRRGDLRHGPWGQALEARRQVVGSVRRGRRSLAIEHRHAGLPAFVVGHHAVECSRGPARRPRGAAPRGRPTDRRATRTSGRRSAPRAACRRSPWRSGSTSFGAARAPVGEQPQRRRERPAIGGELVGEPGRALLVRARPQDPGPLEPPEAVGQDVRGDPRQRLAELAEAARAVEQRLDQQQAPAVADTVEGGLERQGLTLGGGGSVMRTLDGSRSRGLSDAPCQ